MTCRLLHTSDKPWPECSRKETDLSNRPGLKRFTRHCSIYPDPAWAEPSGHWKIRFLRPALTGVQVRAPRINSKLVALAESLLVQI